MWCELAREKRAQRPTNHRRAPAEGRETRRRLKREERCGEGGNSPPLSMSHSELFPPPAEQAREQRQSGSGSRIVFKSDDFRRRRRLARLEVCHRPSSSSSSSSGSSFEPSRAEPLLCQCFLPGLNIIRDLDFPQLPRRARSRTKETMPNGTKLGLDSRRRMMQIIHWQRN